MVSLVSWFIFFTKKYETGSKKGNIERNLCMFKIFVKKYRRKKKLSIFINFFTKICRLKKFVFFNVMYVFFVIQGTLHRENIEDFKRNRWFPIIPL